MKNSNTVTRKHNLASWLLLSCILFCTMLMGMHVQAAGVSSNMLSQIQPYYTYRYSTNGSDSINVGGVMYDDALLFDSYNNVTAEAAFYLEGKFTSLTFDVGHSSGKQTRTLTVYCDGVEAASETILKDDLPTSHHVSLNLTGVQELKFKVSGSTSGFDTAVVNMNLVSANTRDAVVTSNMSTNVTPYAAHYRYKLKDVTVGDKTYQNALTFDTYNRVASYASFNLLGQYKTMSFYVGNATNKAAIQTRTVTIKGDGTELFSKTVSNDSCPSYAQIDVTGVYQLQIEVSGSTSGYDLILGGANLVSNGIVRSVSLDQAAMNLTPDNPSAYLRATVVPTDAANASLTWSSSDPYAASVNANGLVTGHSNGSATITVTTADGGYTAQCLVTVSEFAQSAEEAQTETQTTTDTASQSNDQSTSQNAAKEIKVNESCTVGKASYTVTTVNADGTGTVVYTGTSSTKTSITIPAAVKISGKTYKVTAIAAKAFKGNTKIKSVTIGKNVTTIGAGAFSGCTALKKVTIPAKVTTIKKKAFYGCKKLKSITIKTKKLTSASVGSKAFKGINAKAVIKVPKSCLSAYKTLLRSKGAGSKVTIKK